MPLTIAELESKLWGAADILRGQIDSSDYKNFIFSVLFLKRLSDRFAEEVERLAHVADLDEIAANDHNLNISRYVDTSEPVEVLSVEDALTQLREAERRRDEAAARMDELLAGLGYARDR